MAELVKNRWRRALLLVPSILVVLCVPLVVVCVALAGGRSWLRRSSTSPFKAVSIAPTKVAELFSLLGISDRRSRPLVLEVGDYQCPACRGAEKWVKSNSAGLSALADMQFVDFPLPAHKFAPDAARFALAARASGDLPAVHSWLMTTSDLSKRALTSYGTKLPNGRRIVSDFNRGVFQPVLDSEVKAATILGTNETPSFFVVGRDNSVVRVFMISDLLPYLKQHLG